MAMPNTVSTVPADSESVRTFVGEYTARSLLVAVLTAYTEHIGLFVSCCLLPMAPLLAAGYLLEEKHR